MSYLELQTGAVSSSDIGFDDIDRSSNAIAEVYSVDCYGKDEMNIYYYIKKSESVDRPKLHIIVNYETQLSDVSLLKYNPDSNEIIPNGYSVPIKKLICPSNDGDTEKFLGKLVAMVKHCNEIFNTTGKGGIVLNSQLSSYYNAKDFMELKEFGAPLSTSIRHEDVMKKFLENKSKSQSDPDSVSVFDSHALSVDSKNDINNQKIQAIFRIYFENNRIYLLSIFFLLFYIMIMSGFGYSNNSQSSEYNNPGYQLLLKDCNRAAYNTFNPQAAWPSTTAKYYKEHYQLTNISENSNWYINENLCDGWLFFPSRSSICPMSIAYFKTEERIGKNSGNVKKWEGKYSNYEGAPDNICAEEFVASTRRRLETSTKDTTVKATVPNCIQGKDTGASDIFNKIDEANKLNGINSNFQKGWDQFVSLQEMTAWLWPLSIVLIMLQICEVCILIGVKDQVLYGEISPKIPVIIFWGDFIMFGGTLAAFIGMVKVTNLNESIAFLNEPSKAWEPMFPTCTVDFHIFDGMYKTWPKVAVGFYFLILIPKLYYCYIAGTAVKAQM